MFALLTRTFIQTRIISSEHLKKLCRRPERRFFSLNPYKLDPDVAYIRKLADKNAVEIQLYYVEPEFHIKRKFTFQRQLDESIERSMERMQWKVKNFVLKKMSGRAALPPSDSNSLLGTFGLSMETSTGDTVADTNWSDFLAKSTESREEHVMKLHNKQLKLITNCPYVANVELPSSIMVGYDCYPTNIEMENTSRDECIFRWFKGLPRSTHPNDLFGINWMECGSGFAYRVRPEDIDHKLKLEITPQRDGLIGPALEIYSKNVVIDDITEGHDVFQQRHSLTYRLSTAEKQFRVVSYNLLANFYADSDYSRTELFPYCPPFALAIDYRKRTALREIQGYNGDIICLQEVDKSTFEGDLTMVLATEGYDGLFSRKGTLPEGLVTFYNREKFSLIRRFELDLGQGIMLQPALSSLYEQIKDNTKLCERMLALPSSLQVALFKSKIHNEYLLVANTHLYSQMDAAHIRLLQMGFSMLFIEHVHQKAIEELKIGPGHLSLVFCGDMNSVPDRGVLQFILENRIGCDHIDFRSNEAQAISNVSLEHSFNMRSAYDNSVHTNYTQNFKGCLDYIFYNADKLNLVQTIPMPDDDLLSANDAIPSIYFPSDHLALIADFEWSKKT